MRNWNFYFTILFCFTFTTASFAGAALTNDNCAGAALITLGAECTPTAYMFQGATNSGIDCSNDPFLSSIDPDIWFKAVAPASGNITFEWDDINLVANVFSSSDGTCDNLSAISCSNFGGSIIIADVPVGEMIFIQLQEPPFFTIGLPPTITTVNVCATESNDFIPPTEFNACFDAPKTDITPSANFACYAFSPFPELVSDISPFDGLGCGALLTVFKTIAPESGELTFTTNGGTFDDVAVTVLRGECMIEVDGMTKGEVLFDGSGVLTDDSGPSATMNDAVLVDCQDLNNGPSSGQEEVTLTGLTPGDIICFLVYPVFDFEDGLEMAPLDFGAAANEDKEEATTANFETGSPITVFSDNIKVSLQGGLPDIFNNPEQLFASQNEITFGDPCSCDDPRNCTDGGIQYFHDTLTIPAELTTTPGLTINVSSATNFFVDVPCFGAGLTNATNETIPEVSPGSGVYKIEFWRPSGVVPTLAVTVNGGAPIAAPAATFDPVCTTEACTPAPPIPTMSEWGLMIFGLLVLNLGMVMVHRREELFA